MNAIIVDDERLSLQYMKMCAIEIKELAVVGCFQDVTAALCFLKEHPVDIAFLDIEMPGLNGVDAAKQMRKICPHIGIIFVTGYEDYALQAFKLDAVDYIMKPCTAQMVQKAISKAAKLLHAEKKRRVRIHTFGYFTVYIDGEVYPFTNRKAKELLALLVDRMGGQVTMEQATDILWEDRPYDNMVKQLYRKAVTYLNHIQKETGVQFFASSRGTCQLILPDIECDYYRLLQGDLEMIRSYDGEYMLDYSWAESTAGKIQQMLDYD